MARIQPQSLQGSSVHIAAAGSATFTLPAAFSLGSLEDAQEPVDTRVTTVITCLGIALYNQSTKHLHSICSVMLIDNSPVNYIVP